MKRGGYFWVLFVCLAVDCRIRTEGLVLQNLPPTTTTVVVERHVVVERTNENQPWIGRQLGTSESQLLSLLDRPQELAIDSTTSLLAGSSSSSNPRESLLKNLPTDKIERIVDANTILLKKQGMVRLEGVRMPSVASTNANFQFPTCFAYSPSYKVRQLLPKKTSVLVQTITTTKNNLPQVVLIRSEDSLVVNEELVKTGFALVKTGYAKQGNPKSLLDADSLLAWQETARSEGLGIFSKCDEQNSNAEGGEAFVAEFEPLETTMETVYFSDGGKQQVRDAAAATTTTRTTPTNPGDVKGCSDFDTYEAALQWFETYQPYYGDVAKLDRDGDGVPCPGLPHTTNREKYRMKVPTSSVGMKQ